MRKAPLLFLLFLLSITACRRDTTNLAPGINSNDQSTIEMAKPGPLSVVYIEVNSNNILNSGCYTLLNSGQQLFDIAILFAANINYNPINHRAVEFNNENISKVLQNKHTYIKPLQDKGVKVLLSILGNHQGAGISNFTSRAAVKDFAKQLRDTINFYGLDGVDFDDEYADYGVNGLPQPNDSSFTMLLAACRQLMPDKILSFYYYGPATNKMVYKGIEAGRFLNYSWNAIYGTFNPPAVPGMNKSQLAPAAVWIKNTRLATAKSLATQTVNGDYGAYLFYDLTKENVAGYFSGITNILYGDSTKVDPDCLQPW
jgi:hypothetical protein